MNLRDPRTQLSWLLIFIFLSASLFYKDIFLLRNLAIAVVSTITFDFIFLKIRKIELFPPAAAITTGVILSLLISPKLPFYELVLACAFAVFAKNFIRGGNRHIFNPAAFGVFISSFIFGNTVSWWAVSFQPLYSVFFLILISPLLISMIRLKRFWITIPFLTIYAILIFLLNKTSIVNSFSDPTVLFFSLVMLPEPQTTPNKPLTQTVFGALVALFSIGFSKLILNLDPFVLSLLAGNILFYRLK